MMKFMKKHTHNIVSFTETLTYDNLKKAKLEPKYGPVNSVVLARTPAEDNIVVKDDESITEKWFDRD